MSKKEICRKDQYVFQQVQLTKQWNAIITNRLQVFMLAPPSYRPGTEVAMITA